MPPLNLRPVIAQVHRISRSIGSRRKFSSSSPGSRNELTGAKSDVAKNSEFRASIALGFCIFGCSEVYKAAAKLADIEELQPQRTAMERNENIGS